MSGKMIKFIFTIFSQLILLFLNECESAKILVVIPTPSLSHQLVFRPLTKELAKRGHEIVVITPDPEFEKDKTPPNLIEIDVHNISYGNMDAMYERTSNGDADFENFLESALVMLNDIVEMHFKVPEIVNMLKEKKFDLLLLETITRSALVYSHILNAPVIQIGSFGFTDYDVDMSGAAWHPILYATNFHKKVYNLTSWEKIKLILDQYSMYKIMDSVEKLENVMMKQVLGHNAPTIRELQNNVHMRFINVHPIFSSNRPIPPSVVYIWGIHDKPEKELPQDLKSYLDNSKYGVIYMSFGTNVKSSFLPSAKVQTFVNVFSQLRYDVLWKWDKDVLPGRTDNIRISKWLPQADLLRHKNIKAFITQGGLQSVNEAITAQVPLIGLPMIVDQWYNVENIVRHKIGVGLDINTLQENQLRKSIETVIEDTSFRQNIIHLSKIISDEPMRPLDRAVWWTEYVLRHGGARHLQTPAANLTWTEYFELDLIFTILLILLITLFGVILLTMKLAKNLQKRLGLIKKIKNN